MFGSAHWAGGAHLPLDGPVVVVSNHISFFDPVVLAAFVDHAGRTPRFLAKAELFRVPLLGRLLHAAGQIPVHRDTASAVRAYEAAVAAVQAGECVVLYPEGTLTHDPDLWPMRGRTGAARIALTTRAPVVPVAQWGVQQILPPRRRRALRLLARPELRALAGPPVPLADLYDLPVTAEVLQTATDRLTDAVTDLLEVLRGAPAPDSRLDPRTMGRQPRRPAPTQPGPADDERRSTPMNARPTHRSEDDA